MLGITPDALESPTVLSSSIVGAAHQNRRAPVVFRESAGGHISSPLSLRRLPLALAGLEGPEDAALFELAGGGAVVGSIDIAPPQLF